MPDDHIKRCDVRVPIDLYNEIEKIAVEEYNAPLYHKTGKPQVSSTIIELLKLGIENLRGKVSDVLPDTLSDKVRELELQIKQIQSASLSDSKPDTIPDTNIDEKIAHAIRRLGASLITNLKSDEEFLGAIAVRVQQFSAVGNDTPEQAEVEENEQETTTQIDKVSLAPIFEEVEESKPDQLLSLKEAFAIAIEQGYKSSETAFAQWFRDNKNSSLHGIKKHSERGKYIVKNPNHLN